MKIAFNYKFFLSFLIGSLAGYIVQDLTVKNPTPLETSVGQIIFENFSSYQEETDLRAVLRVVENFANGKTSLKSQNEVYQPILEMRERKAEEAALFEKERAEMILKDLQRENPKILAIVPDRVYVEVLEEGTGKFISSDETIRIRFKEFDLDGQILKDTHEEVYTIPLSQMIKGFQFGMKGARIGERRKLYIHPDYGFGKMGRKTPNRLLIYEVSLIDRIRGVAPLKPHQGGEAPLEPIVF